MDDIYIPGVLPKNSDVARARFGLRNGQVFSEYIYQNLWWALNNETLGFGDLRAEDLVRIQKSLKDDEIFCGWNQHQGTPWQQTPKPMVRITTKVIGYPHRNEDNYPDETQED